MTTALYRRYRPETFGEMIGQSQVTDPLMTALRGDRVGHAYLFSGPRGCGKTTSARILARCLNCAEGPTDVPCGTCPSCVELARSGGGSLDVVEIDAASHNGVDDARDLRERATFAPSRDRYKIFILDEAHMVTPQGFNALLKLVEEPPEHVKFIFATTEPEKVLGTIRSRTHHYPFRLVPPAAMLEYVEKLCAEERVVVEQGVLPLVVRAGGGSPRDTLSLLDQLIAGSDAPAGSETVTVGYARAVALLGYTHGALLDEIVDALAAGDAAAAFPAIDRVVQTGQDPRRFVDDLLERLRDLIVIAAVGSGASAVLRGIAEDDLERMRGQAQQFGAARLSRTADVVSAALDDMTGATSPRLHLELLVARVLTAAAVGDAAAPVAPASVRPAVAAGTPQASASTAAPASSAAPPATAPAATPIIAPVTMPDAQTPASPTLAPPAIATPGLDEDAPIVATEPPASESSVSETAASEPPVSEPAVSESSVSDPAVSEPATAGPPTTPVTFAKLTAAWPAVLTRLEGISRTSWLVVTTVQPLAYDTDSEVLTLGFASQHDVGKFKGTTPGSGTSDHLRSAIEQELGVRVKYLPAPLPAGGASRASETPVKDLAGPKDSAPSASAPSASAPSAGAPSSSASTRATPGSAASPTSPRTHGSAASAVTEWAVAAIPAGETPSVPDAPLAVDDEPEEVEAAASAPTPPHDGTVDQAEPPLPGDDDAPDVDDEPPYDPAYEPSPNSGPPSAPPQRPSAPPQRSAAGPSAVATQTVPAPRAAAPVVSERTPAPGGVQRYGEAVIRQVLGATFVREEPYEPPTRFA